MNEAYVSGRIRELLKSHIGGGVIIKHNDRSTAGIPDLSVTFARRTFWIEDKLLKKNETHKSLLKHFDKVQLVQACQLDAHGYCFYFVAYPDGKVLRAMIIRPHSLAHHILRDPNTPLSPTLLRSIADVDSTFEIVVDRLGHIMQEVTLAS